MGLLNWLKTPAGLLVKLGGMLRTIHRSDARFAEIENAIKQGDMGIVEEKVFAVEKSVEKTEIFKIDNGVIQVKGEDVVPAFIEKRLQEHAANGVEVKSLENFWNKLKQNPHVQNQETLLLFLEKNKFPLLQNGNFIGFKGLNENYTDKHSSKFDMSPGITRNWEADHPGRKIDYMFGRDCHDSGYHVGSLSYSTNANSYGKTVEVEVDPRDVIYVSPNNTSWKIRVAEFKSLCDCRFKTADEIPYVDGANNV
jgi:hypothetical protein